MKALAVALVGLVVALGCSHPSNMAAPSHLTSSADLPAGWSRVMSDSGDVSMGLPPGWESMDISKSAIEKRVLTKFRKSPHRAEIVAAAYEAVQDMKLMVKCPRDQWHGFAANANVIAEPTGSSTLKLVCEGNKTDLEKIGAKNVTLTTLALPTGEAGLITYQKVIGRSSGSLSVQGQCYVFLRNDRTYLLTFLVPSSLPSLDTEILEMAKTLVVK